jgi:tetratricopeptide (TPR) repeat protein
MSKQSILNPSNYILLGILFLTFIVFSGALDNGFTNWDDDVYVYNNFLIRNFSLENLQKIFSEPMGASQIYRPLTYLTYLLDFQLWELNPYGYHLSSLLFHLLNVVLVFQIVKLLNKNLIVSSLVALFFAINPLKVEAVAWASSRVDVVFSAFYLGAMLTYILYLQNNLKVKYLIFTSVLFIFSLLSKPSAVTFPLVCLLLDYFLERKWSIKIVVEKLPLFAFSLVMGVITLLAQRPDTVLVTGISAFSLVDRFFIICYMPLFYLFKSIFPFALSNYYDFPSRLNWLHYISPAIVAVCGFFIYKVRNNRAVIFSILFFVLHLSLVLNLLPTGNKFMAADRYAYLAQMGLFFLLSYLYITANEGVKNVYLGIFVVLFLMYASISFKRTDAWENGFTLWTDAVQKNDKCAFCVFGLGNILINSGQQQNALSLIEKSIQLNPKIGESYHSLGTIQFALKDYKNALVNFDKSIALNPTYQYSYASRGSTYATLKEYDKALQDFQKALALNPNDIETYLNRGIARGILKNFAGAKADLDIYISYYPNNAKALYNRGFANASLGNITGCCGDWKRAYDLGIPELKSKLVEYCGYKF